MSTELGEADLKVMAFLVERGTGPVSTKEIADGTGLKRVTAGTCLYALESQGMLCRLQLADQIGSGRYFIRHLHLTAEDCNGPLNAGGDSVL